MALLDAVLFIIRYIYKPSIFGIKFSFTRFYVNTSPYRRPLARWLVELRRMDIYTCTCIVLAASSDWGNHICSNRLLQTLWQKEKLLMMSNFTFCHNVFNCIWLFKNFSFMEIFLIVANMFSRSSAAECSYVGTG